ncbi:MAG TPA: helix-turn-helix transcriptional regulator [Chthoniobacterales bacterium]|nr:helix-turn-helix transcriptional regulator [Chthoniobacterales bacterium]
MPSPNSRSRGHIARRAPKRTASTEERPLTKRELEVVEWIAAGKRNGEIGQILECSPRTVQKHVQNILAKLDLETRTAICLWWYEKHLNGRRATRPRRKRPRA